MASCQMQSFDLDGQQDFDNALRTATDYSTQNFLVNFSADKASCSTNLDSDQIRESVKSQGSAKIPSCRWFNIWTSNHDQCESTRAVLATYGVSPRLAHLLCPDRRPRQLQDQHLSSSAASSEEPIHQAPEKAGLPTLFPALSNANQRSYQAGQDIKPGPLSMSNIPNDLWHFCSIDWGRRFVCISYNALFTAVRPDEGTASRRPDAIRVWSAVVLGDDGAVISIFETPSNLTPDEVKAIRKNQLNILKNISRQYDPLQSETGIFQVDLRPPVPGSKLSEVGGTSDPYEMASRLFYYIFDDWRATFELVSGRHHPYRRKLDGVRSRMSQAPAVKDIEKLHQIGQQLVTLQRVYQGYEKILERLLQRERHLSSLLWRTAQGKQSDPALLTHQWSSEPESTAWVMEADGDQKTIRLPLSTVARFERLLDRIRLYALAEIEECLAEKESLVMVTFNLVNLKNATVIERLTRTTILLARVTIFFLPISLMTGYFGMSITAVTELYSMKTYWACFVIVGFLTLLLLFTLNIANNKVTGKTVYQGLTRMLFQGAKKKSNRVRAAAAKDLHV